MHGTIHAASTLASRQFHQNIQTSPRTENGKTKYSPMPPSWRTIVSQLSAA